MPLIRSVGFMMIIMMGNIAADFFNRKLKEYKDREQEIERELQHYAVKDTNVHVAANTVLSLTSRARELF